MTLRLPDDLDADLRAAAEGAHVSINNFVVEAIKERLEELHHESVMAIARGVIERDAEILHRLATA
ncbi:MAG TPA: toxin-antitoxin system HicB family antitoxin [Pseudonocardiaceae bacterium]|nr:toxin-antitoxin system HicB family antitoxin [Pseudonocardiaceae bacterium]